MRFRTFLIVLLATTLLAPPFDSGFATLAAQDLRGRFDPLLKPDSRSKWDSFTNREVPGQTASTDDLKIVVIEGEDGVNIIKKQTAVQPVVEVRDRNDLPVAGAEVVFATPGFGPGGVFVNGGHTFSVITDASGRAAASGMKPTGTGSFQITVTAHSGGHSGKAVISQTNVVKVAGASAVGGVFAAHWLIIGSAVAAAAVVGSVVAVNNAGGKATGTIGAPGTPSITAPH